MKHQLRWVNNPRPIRQHLQRQGVKVVRRLVVRMIVGVHAATQTERQPPAYLRDHQCKSEHIEDEQKVDYVYRAVYNVPKTYAEAMSSERSQTWVKAMEDEIKENDTYTLCTLPKGKRAVGGRLFEKI